jgi:hypothetical protein
MAFSDIKTCSGQLNFGIYAFLNYNCVGGGVESWIAWRADDGPKSVVIVIPLRTGFDGTSRKCPDSAAPFDDGTLTLSSPLTGREL